MLTCYCLLLILFIKYSSASSNDFMNKNELGYLRQDIGLLREENKIQNMDIVLLKEIIESQDKRIHQTITEELDKRMNYDESSLVRENQYSTKVRQKRPYRLLPTQNKGFEEIGKSKNNFNLNQHQGTFYGPPTNCSDLFRLGYTLNGYYFVKTDESNNEVKNLQSIYCAFKQLEGPFNSSTLEKRIGHLKLINVNKSTEFSGGNFSSIGKSDVDVKGRGTHTILPPRMANLINGLGKCAAIRDNVSIKNKNLIQWECNQKAKGMLWSWNIRPLLVAEIDTCATVMGNARPRLEILLPIFLSFNGKA